MLLTARDGSQVEAHIVGYESPTADANWLMVSIQVVTPEGSGSSVEPCWQTEEVRRMVVWFTAMAEGTPVVSWGGACLEANLECEMVAATLETVTLRVSFIFEHGFWHPANGRRGIHDFGSHVDVELARSDIRRVADELAVELQQYPPLVPERELPSPFLVPLFAALQDDSPDVRRRALLLTPGPVLDPAAVPALLAGLAIPHRDVRAYVATALGEIGDRRAALPLIEVLRSDETGDVWANPRARAAEALGQLGDLRAVEPLIAALGDEDLETRGKALEALGRLGDLRAVEPLIAATRDMRNPSGATILGNLGDRRAVEPLLADLEEVRPPDAARSRPPVPWQDIYYYYAIRALGKLGDRRAAPLLEWVRDHKRYPVLKGKSLGDVAAKALGKIAERTRAEVSTDGAEEEPHGGG